MKDKLEDFLSEVRLIVQEDLVKGEAFASIKLNPSLRWMKFILLDDKPNGNKQRVPKEEFSNIIKTGVHMPIKMAEGAIADGHDEALPIGVITNLKQINNRIEGLAALWSRERPEDIDYIINEFEAGNVPQISYELPFEEYKESEAGVQDLYGTSLGAATLVNMPAFKGRTPVVALASDSGDGDTTLEETKLMDELETLKQQYSESQDTIKELEKELAEQKEAQASVDKELEELREFKAEIEKKAEEADKLDKVEKKFAEAGIEKDNEYFEDNKELLLGLDETAIDFMVQELVSFASKKEDKKADLEDEDAIPPLSGEKNTKPTTMKELSDALNKSMRKDK
jgi:hypothetical protein